MWWQSGTPPHATIPISEIVLTGYLNTEYLNSTYLKANITLEVIPGPVQLLTITPSRDIIYAENSNWWLPDAGVTIVADTSLLTNNQGFLNVFGFDELDISELIKCKWINYQKPSSWEQRFSQNLTTSRYSNTKYFSEFPQIAYQSSNYPILDTYDRFNVTTNYYIAAWGILRNPLVYNKTGIYVMSNNQSQLYYSITWEQSGLLNLSMVVNNHQVNAYLPVNACTSNDFLETGIVIINGTLLGVLASSTIIWLNHTHALDGTPIELRVYGNLFRGSEIRDNINVTRFMQDISPDGLSPNTCFIPLFANSFFLSTYQSVSLSLTYSFEITSPIQDEARFRNWTFSQSDIYFRTGQSRGTFSAISSRTLLSILYLMRIMQLDTEYSRAELYNRSIVHSGLAGKRAQQSVRIDIALQYVMLTREYIVPLTLEFSVTFEYIIYAFNKPPVLMDYFLGGPVIALLIPLILLIIFPLVFYDASGKNKLFAGIGLLVGIIINAVLGLIDPVLSVLFAFGACGIIYLMLQKNGRNI
jgi:hypothetical protein